MLSGTYKRFSYSLGQFHYETDGFREDNGIEHDIYDFFLQTRLTNSIDAQFEYRHRNTDQGELRLRADPQFQPTDRRTLGEDTARLGLRVATSPRSDLLLSALYNERDTGFQRDDRDFGVTIRDDAVQEGYDIQLQHLFHSKLINFILGGGVYHFNEKGQMVIESEFDIPPSPPSELTGNGHNAYLYSNVLLPRGMHFTLGVGFDSFDQEAIDVNKINPKVGLWWDINKYLRLRMAAFTAVRRALIFNQTIEPTQLAGFTQFYDDANGTQSKFLGTGVDVNIYSKIFATFELSTRDFDFPLSGGGFEGHKEDLYRGYIYWTPHKSWSIRTEPQLQRVDSEFSVFNEPDEIKTTTVPVAVQYFSPKGFFAELGATYLGQSLDFKDEPPLGQDGESFFVLDAAVGYRLPKRLGIASFEVKNLFDRDFLFEDPDNRIRADQFNSDLRFVPVPDRTVLLRLTLSF